MTPSQLWQTLFGPTTDVTPYEFASFAGQLIRSYPAWNVRDFLWSTYTQIASQYPSDYPPYSALVGETEPEWFGQLPINSQSLQAVIDQIDSALASSGGAIPPGAPDPATDVVQAWLYSQPLAPGSPAMPPPPPIPTQPDFHQMLSTIGKYPVLLRALGLVYDLQVERPSGLAAEVPLSVTPTWTPLLSPPSDTQNALPAVQTTSSTFLAAARPTSPFIAGGLLRLDSKLASGDAEFPLVEVELDGSATKSLNFVQGITNAVTVRQSWDTPRLRGAIAALRWRHSSPHGHRLGFHGRPGERAVSQRGARSALPPDSLRRGRHAGLPHRRLRRDRRSLVPALREGCRRHRVRWRRPEGLRDRQRRRRDHHLTARRRRRHIRSRPRRAGAPFDEGWVELSLTQSPPGVSPASDLYLHEKLCRWDGWSLVASRPGKHWAETSNTPAANAYNSDNPTKLALRVAHAAAPATLPLLRFGRTYRFRARAVDLAGNGLDFTSAAPASTFTHATSALVYGRFEPIATPVCVPTAPRTPGEHLLNIVIRSETYDTPPSTVTPSYRHVQPPSTSVELAERHGMFDVGGSPSGSAATYELIADSVGLTYATPSVVSSLGGVLDSSWVNALWPEDVYYYPSTFLSCPYLPDVLARGATFQDLPGSTAASPLLQVPYASASPWPAVTPLDVEFSSGTAAPTLVSSSSGNVVQVQAPPGTITTARLSAYVGSGDLPDLSLWRWLEAAGLSNAALQSLVTTGQH